MQYFSSMRVLSVCCVFIGSIVPAVGQQSQSDPPIDEAMRAAIIDGLVSKIEVGYVVPEAGQRAVRDLRAAVESHAYDGVGTARQFAEKLTSELRASTRDKHIAVYFDPAASMRKEAAAATTSPREHFNFGFYKIERLRGNVGYLDLRSFADLSKAKETSSAFLNVLADFDAIIIDVRQNGGGNTPMVAHIASYFFGPKPVHLTDMYWRDQNRTIELWTSENVVGRRSVGQELYILVGPSTFSAAEDFSYSLQQLRRATIVGEKTGGGAHMGRGLQRLSPLFTAFIPTGQSLNPITKSNWENVGVQPDVEVPAERALIEAHVLALRKQIQKEIDPEWRETLRKAVADLAAGK